VANTWFPHDHVHTWERGESRTIIDYFLVDERLREKVLDSYVEYEAEGGTDHYLVLTKLKLNGKC